VSARCGCGRRWESLTEAHCAAVGCHCHFGSVAAFDVHRVGGQRVNPASLAVRSGPRRGESVLRPVERGGRETWVSAREASPEWLAAVTAQRLAQRNEAGGNPSTRRFLICSDLVAQRQLPGS